MRALVPTILQLVVKMDMSSSGTSKMSLRLATFCILNEPLLYEPHNCIVLTLDLNYSLYEFR